MGVQGVVGQCPILPTPHFFRTSGESLRFDKLIVAPGTLDSTELSVFNQFLGIKDVTLIQSDTEKPNLIFKTFAVDFSNLDRAIPAPLPPYHPQKSHHSYNLSVDKEQILIIYTSKASKMHALLSLVQLIEDRRGRLVVPETAKLWANQPVNFSIDQVRIVDYPKFNWRGLHLDVARHFFTVDEVKRFIDLMAFYKFNRFHWHLTDDQGWRIEIKKYPRLTEIGAFRDSTLNGHYNQVPRTYSTERTGGFYTQEEIKDVVAYAKMRHIEIVPEIEMPGHARAALAAYPELSCTEKQQSVPGIWGVFEDIFCSKPESISFLKDVLEEVVALFPNEYVHIGGDEAPKMRWHACAKCQGIIKANGLKDEHELQSYFIQQMDDFLTAKGKKLIGWDEILEGGLSTNAAVMSWRGEQGGIDAANLNHNVVMSPTTYCYFDYYQSGDESEPLAIGGYLPLEKVYEYSPYPKELAKEKQQFILGGQANLWTEYIPTFSHLEYMTYPRAIALMQGLWCYDKPSYDDFITIFKEHHEPLLQGMNVNYSRSIYLPKMEVSRVEGGVRYSFKSTQPNEVIDVRFDGENVGPYLDVFPSENGEQNLVSFSAASTKNLDERTIKFVNINQHNGLGLDIELVTQPHPKYAHNGALTLSDGILGSRPWKGDQWLGFNEDSVEFILNIPKGKKIEDITLGFLDAKGSWIYLPFQVEYFVAGRKGKWLKLAGHAVISEYQKTTLNIKTQRLKIRITPIRKIPQGAEGAGNRPWIFLDEVILNYKQ